ncbi:5-pentadecatrienyl resorcinol O-methyltransferase-like [Miscanthus floridulus]|uniref:5-pentadecatrienyl resorcinol O-methyltransferase-like n=1 Tax=Miscanthus floridulus TaxID=154761 RepID=UPI00345B16C7
MALVEESSQDLLQAYVELWHQSLCFAKSMALAVALDLRIPDAIHRHGGGATLPQILTETALHPNKLVYRLTAASRFLVSDECGEVFRGIDSLVDIGGGHGGATAIVAAAFPHLKCSLLDLPHVVAGAPCDGNVQFVAGNMFESIPPATAVFLKGEIAPHTSISLHRTQAR